MTNPKTLSDGLPPAPSGSTNLDQRPVWRHIVGLASAPVRAAAYLPYKALSALLFPLTLIYKALYHLHDFVSYYVLIPCFGVHFMASFFLNQWSQTLLTSLYRDYDNILSHYGEIGAEETQCQVIDPLHEPTQSFPRDAAFSKLQENFSSFFLILPYFLSAHLMRSLLTLGANKILDTSLYHGINRKIAHLVKNYPMDIQGNTDMQAQLTTLRALAPDLSENTLFITGGVQRIVYMAAVNIPTLWHYSVMTSIGLGIMVPDLLVSSVVLALATQLPAQWLYQKKHVALSTRTTNLASLQVVLQHDLQSALVIRQQNGLEISETLWNERTRIIQKQDVLSRSWNLASEVYGDACYFFKDAAQWYGIGTFLAKGRIPNAMRSGVLLSLDTVRNLVAFSFDYPGYVGGLDNAIKQFEKAKQTIGALEESKGNNKIHYSTQHSHPEQLLSVRDLTITPSEKQPLFSDASFSLYKGQRVLVQGENGVGKSILMAAIAPRITHSTMHAAGTVTWGASDKTAEPITPHFLSGYYCPSFVANKDGTQRPATLLDAACYPRRYDDLADPAKKTELLEKAAHYLIALDYWKTDSLTSSSKKKQNRMTSNEALTQAKQALEKPMQQAGNASMSTGQQKKLLLASMLLGGAECVICDEVFANLSPDSIAKAKSLIERERPSLSGFFIHHDTLSPKDRFYTHRAEVKNGKVTITPITGRPSNDSTHLTAALMQRRTYSMAAAYAHTA